MKDPAFLFYSSDFLSGVQDLTYEERGQYITMLCVQHQKGVISSKWLSINLPNASSDVLAKFKQDENGDYHNERLTQEVNKRKSYKPKKIAAATLGGLISRSNISKELATKIRAKFSISDYEKLEDSEIKHKLSIWFKQMLNLLENENEIENEDVNKLENKSKTEKKYLKPTFKQFSDQCKMTSDTIRLRINESWIKEKYKELELINWKRSDGSPIDNWQSYLLRIMQSIKEKNTIVIKPNNSKKTIEELRKQEQELLSDK